ncbi:hypothetical protein ADK45_34760 [Streptomyces rimosus subsp. rimosus]|nr:hypothetical protein ADK45_34760 [Streptomyces rimosus subsp. rimosus]
MSAPSTKRTTFVVVRFAAAAPPSAAVTRLACASYAATVRRACGILPSASAWVAKFCFHG